MPSVSVPDHERACAADQDPRSLGRRCQYEPRILARRDDSALKSSTRLHVKDFPLPGPLLFDGGAFLKSSVNIAITEKLALAVGEISGIRLIAAKFFHSIQLCRYWEQILHAPQPISPF